MSLPANTQLLTVTNSQPMLVSSGNAARKKIEIFNYGPGDLIVSFNQPTFFNTGIGLYSGLKVLAGDYYINEINCSTDQVYMISTDPVNGSSCVFVETFELKDTTQMEYR